MKKALYVAWKDTRIRLADRGALIFLLLTPFALTLIMGAAFGGLGGSDNSGLGDIPVAVVNLDDGELGQALADVFASDDLGDLFDTQIKTTEADARSAEGVGLEGHVFDVDVLDPGGGFDLDDDFIGHRQGPCKVFQQEPRAAVLVRLKNTPESIRIVLLPCCRATRRKSCFLLLSRVFSFSTSLAWIDNSFEVSGAA